MKTNWLWDSRITEKNARKILNDSNHPKFDIYAEKLFSRINDPKKAFSIVDKLTFCRKWPVIKKRMRKDRWLRDRVIFWQTIYNRVKEQLNAEGIKIRTPRKEKISAERLELAKEIRDIRIGQGYRQKDLASKLNVIQQYISKIESGRENFSIDTLIRVADVLGKKIYIHLK